MGSLMNRISFILSAIIFLGILLSCSNISLRRSPESIQKNLIQETPIGSTYDDVIINLRKKELQWISIDGRQVDNIDSAKKFGRHINISLGQYHSFLLVTSVVVDYRFDSLHILEHLKVKKATDGI